MKRFLLPAVVILMFAGCDDGSAVVHPGDGGAPAGICEVSKCPAPAKGIACCTPDAACGTDPTGVGVACTRNAPPDRICKVSDCPPSTFGAACCTPLAQCGVDPFSNGVFCFPPPVVSTVDAGHPCNVDKCPQSKNKNAPKACCQLNGDCGLDTTGLGLCFPPPEELCDLSTCPHPDGGVAPCCLPNGQCGEDVFGNGFCVAPPAKTCDLNQCHGSGDIKACCLPDGECGLDSLGVGFCFPPPVPVKDAGPPPQVDTSPPDDPSVNGECPSYLGLFGPVWGCCSGFGVCGTFADNACLLPLGTQLPVGPAVDSGKPESFLRCTPPPKTVKPPVAKTDAGL